VIDETMVKWAGVSAIQLTWLPRKPTPLGFLVKTLCDAKTGILLSMELVEGVQFDRNKKYYNDLGHTAAVTVRVTEPYHRSGRVVVADAWFGSYKTAVALW
jgi:Transposase IS4